MVLESNKIIINRKTATKTKVNKIIHILKIIKSIILSSQIRSLS